MWTPTRRLAPARARRLVVRHGQAEARKVTCGASTVEVRAPRVNDKRVDATGQRERFTSRILPPYMRRSPKVAEVLPILYLRGLSTGDFRETLPVLLGDDTAGLSATNIARLTAVCLITLIADPQLLTISPLAAQRAASQTARCII